MQGEDVWAFSRFVRSRVGVHRGSGGRAGLGGSSCVGRERGTVRRLARGEALGTGWARTDSEGRFEFRTIRPGAYPSGTDAAHIHLTLFTADGTAYHAGGLLFDDDSLVSAAEREESRLAGEFGRVCALRREGAVEHVDIGIRLDPRRRF